MNLSMGISLLSVSTTSGSHLPLPKKVPDNSNPDVQRIRKDQEDNVATKFPDLPANISYNTLGALNELPLDVSNVMD
ncbi:hypothetical protein DSO57_1015548 [Entomophthora muscae]|uniref:Uncharacterized protein n=1 Tax=Entomophthora muscae TaxID=34485 RepID=A0ACC2S7G2_9FUNG|nr:hypothetical protein DSO57_1015548 [Entomophthora muscae]